MTVPFVDPPKVIEACEQLARTFHAFADEDDANGLYENAARLRRDADAHLRMADNYRAQLPEQHEAA